MRITTYRTELDENKHNVLIKENSCNYPMETETLNNAPTIVKMLNAVYRLNRQAEEHLYMIALSIKCRPLGVFEISHGTVDCTVVNPRDVFIKALLCGASAIVIAHNHPSGDVTPSKEDRNVYERIRQCGELLGVQLLDSLIVGDSGTYFSMKDACL
jgi:DNA repair protein RadC